VLESVAYQAQCGWAHHFRTRNIVPWGYVPFRDALKNIAKGDMLALQQQLDNGGLTPLDEEEAGMTLLSVSTYMFQSME
jgi:hypothetical protein